MGEAIERLTIKIKLLKNYESHILTDGTNKLSVATLNEDFTRRIKNEFGKDIIIIDTIIELLEDQFEQGEPCFNITFVHKVTTHY